MRRTYVYFISIMIMLSGLKLRGQDTVMFPLKIRAGVDIAGPGIYAGNRDNLSLEGYISFDRNEKTSYVIEAGYLDYKYSQYNYSYSSNGVFARLGADFNMLQPTLAAGKHWAGIGLRYGIGIFNAETPSFEYTNYWGKVSSSVPSRASTGHFIEVVPGVRTELFRNLSMGWNIRLKLLIAGGGGKDLRPIYFPGYGNSGKRTAAGITYYISWNIPYKIKRVITLPKEPEEEEESPEAY